MIVCLYHGEITGNQFFINGFKLIVVSDNQAEGFFINNHGTIFLSLAL